MPRPLFRLFLSTLLVLHSTLIYGKEINNIEHISLKKDKGILELSLKTTQPVQIFSSSISTPPKIEIEFKNPLGYKPKEQILLEKNSPIDKIKLLTKPQEKEGGGLVSHLILELKVPLGYEISKHNDRIALRLYEKSKIASRPKEIETPVSPTPRSKERGFTGSRVKKKEKFDSPERIVERDFIEFIKKARIRWKKEEETIKRLLAQIERERYLEERRLKKKEHLKEKEKKRGEEQNRKKEQLAKQQKDIAPKAKAKKQEDISIKKEKDRLITVKPEKVESEENLGVILITKTEEALPPQGTHNVQEVPALKKKFSEEKNVAKPSKQQKIEEIKSDKLKTLSEKEEELKRLIQESQAKLENLVKEKEYLLDKPKKETVIRNKAEALRDKAYSYLMEDKVDKAIKYYQLAIKLDPKYPTPHNDLGIIYEEKGLLEKAAEEYKKAIELDPNYAAAYSNLALLYEKQGKLSEALQYWKKRASLGKPDEEWTKRAIEKANEYKKSGIN